MKRTIVAVALATLAVGMIGYKAVADDTAPTTQPAAPASALDFKAKDIDGNVVDLAKFKGDVVLVVNVASKCGNTPQYKDLEELYDKEKGNGLTILGFPANDFHAQEPGTNEDIKKFCTLTYQVAFPMFSKIAVKGAEMDPLYKFLTAQKTAPQPAGDITWNFEKFLIGRDGKVVARFAPKTKVTEPTVAAAIAAELAKPKP